MVAKASISENLAARFCTFLDDTMGLYFPPKTSKELEKKLIAIAKTFGYDQVSDCLEWLMQGTLTDEQMEVLAHHLTIGETYFFRDKRAFSLLEHSILPRLIHVHNKDKRLRIWSAACCTGEEPYSIAILLDSLLPKINNWDVLIIATDINKEFLRKAETACYKSWSFRATPPEIKSKYFFKAKDNNLTLLPQIKKLVKFDYLNLVEDSYPDSSILINNLDLIICSNVLIYFSPKQIAKTIHQLALSLKEEGWLLVSPIESPYVKESGMRLINMDGYAVFQKTSEIASLEPKAFLKKDIITDTAIIDKDAAKFAMTPDFLNVFPAAFKFQFNEPSSSAQAKAKEPKSQPSHAAKDKTKHSPEPVIHKSKLLEKVHHLADEGKLQEAKHYCEQALQQDKLNPLLHYLFATILQLNNDDDGAVAALKKALFLDNDFAIAHFTLGMLLRKQKRSKEALRHMRNARQLLQKCQPDEIVLGSDDMTAATLLDIISQYER